VRPFWFLVRTPARWLPVRAPKGMYTQAEKGVIRDFTGISAPYEAPLEPSLVLAQ